MPAYGTIASAPALYPGEQQTLIGFGDTTTQTTQQVAIPQDATDPTGMLTLINTCGQIATVAIAAQDTGAAAYQPLTDGETGTAITVANNKAVKFRCKGPLLLCTLAGNPNGTGSLVLCR